jgi:hypothetical protein
MVAPVDTEFKAALALFTHATQPEAAFVAMVAVTPFDNCAVVDKLLAKVSVFPERLNVKVDGTVAVIAIWSSGEEIIEVAYVEEFPPLAIVPVLSFPAVLVVTAVVLVQLKQYKVLAVKLELGKVTTCPVTSVAVPIPSHPVAPEGRFEVSTVNVAAKPNVKPVGNVTTTLDSVTSVTAVFAHIRPVVAVDAFIRSNRTHACCKLAACALFTNNIGTAKEKTNMSSVTDPIKRLCLCIFFYFDDQFPLLYHSVFLRASNME